MVRKRTILAAQRVDEFSFLWLTNLVFSLDSSCFHASEENIYEDRLIKDYIRDDALKMLLEADRIKSIIRDFEQDLWNN